MTPTTDFANVGGGREEKGIPVGPPLARPAVPHRGEPAARLGLKHLRTCHLCEAMCGVVLEVEDERVVEVRGDTEDPFSAGYICPKYFVFLKLRKNVSDGSGKTRMLENFHIPGKIRNWSEVKRSDFPVYFRIF